MFSFQGFCKCIKNYFDMKLPKNPFLKLPASEMPPSKKIETMLNTSPDGKERLNPSSINSRQSSKNQTIQSIKRTVSETLRPPVLSITSASHSKRTKVQPKKPTTNYISSNNSKTLLTSKLSTNCNHDSTRVTNKNYPSKNVLRCDYSSKIPLLSSESTNKVQNRKITSALSYTKTKCQINKLITTGKSMFSLKETQNSSKIAVRISRYAAREVDYSSSKFDRGLASTSKFTKEEQRLKGINKFSSKSDNDGSAVKKLNKEKSSELLICPTKKESSRNIQLKSAKITKNLKLNNQNLNVVKSFNRADFNHYLDDPFSSISSFEMADSSLNSVCTSLQDTSSTRPSSISLSRPGVPERKSPSASEMFASRNLLLEDSCKGGYVTMQPRCNTLGVPPLDYELLKKPKIWTLPNRKKEVSRLSFSTMRNNRSLDPVTEAKIVGSNICDDAKSKPYCKLVSICNRVMKENQFSEFIGPYPARPTLSKQAGSVSKSALNTVENSSGLNKALTIDIAVLEKQNDLFVKDILATDEQKSKLDSCSEQNDIKGKKNGSCLF